MTTAVNNNSSSSLLSSSSTPPTGQTSDSSSALLSQDYTTFLKMLTTQLKNQDPLSPMDSSQFTQQLVSFASVEQQIKANQNLQSLISLQQKGGAQQALGYLGKIAEVKGDSMPVVNGAGAFSYSLSGVSTNTDIQIKDANGNVVRQVTGDTSVGKHVVTWDGTDSSGTKLPDGLYTISVNPSRGDGTQITATTTVYGVVNSVQTNADGTTSLSMTYLQGTPDDILSVNTALGGNMKSIGTPTPPTNTANDNTGASDTGST